MIDLESRRAHARDRADVVRRDRAGAARSRRCRIRPSPSCSCRPNLSPSVGALLATRRPRSPDEPESGRRTWPSSKASASAPCNSRPTGRGFSGAAAASARRCRSSTAARSPTRSAPCSIRSSVCAAASGSRRERRARVTFWTLVAPIARRGARPGRQASRRRCVRARGHAGLDPGAGPASSSRHRRRRGAPLPSASPTASSTPTRRCGRRPTCSQRNDRRAVGAVGARHLRRSADRAVPHR